MSSYVIRGGQRLKGELRVDGAKNAVLPILAATLLLEQPVTLRDCPQLTDVAHMLSILESLGCRSQRQGNDLCVDASGAGGWEMLGPLAKRLRSSFFLLGPTLGRFGKACFTYPGGCEIGQRPVDLHLVGLRKLGVTVREEGGCIHCDGQNMRGGDIHLDYPSVGATENLMMAAACATGDTVITNAAREPEIQDLQDFLNGCGAKIQGAGSSTLSIHGVGSYKALCAATFHTMPDRIVAGTYMTAAAITGGELTLHNVCAGHVASVIHKLREAGCDIQADPEAPRGSLTIRGPRRPRELPLLETSPYPGFPTDMQAPVFALATVAQGTSVVVENVFDSRFKHAAELVRMGASVTIRDRVAIIRGVDHLCGERVAAMDLRGGAALVLAALVAQDETVVQNVHHIRRGYVDLAGALSAVGADIWERP